MLIGIVGFIGSGKGTVGDMLEARGFIKDSFAKPLKDACAMIFGWDRQLLEGDTKESRAWREEPDAFWSEKFGYEFTPRKALQLMGTESCRNVFHQDVWIISLIHRHLTDIALNKNVVITDVRFRNEVEAIHLAGGQVVRVMKGNEPHWYRTAWQANIGDLEAVAKMKALEIHPSEWDWIGSSFNFEIPNNGTLQELETAVGDLVYMLQ